MLRFPSFSLTMASQLVKYLAVVTVFALFWLSLLPLDYVIITYAPIIAIMLLGIYAVLSVLYGVATFNDCEYAKVSLQKEISEARCDRRLPHSVKSAPSTSNAAQKRKCSSHNLVECSSKPINKKALLDELLPPSHRLVPNILRVKRTPGQRSNNDKEDDKSRLTSKELVNEIEDISSSDDEERERRKKRFVYIRQSGYVEKTWAERKKKQYDPFEPKYKTPMALELCSLLEGVARHRTFWRANNPSYQTLDVKHMVDIEGCPTVKWGMKWYNAKFQPNGRSVAIIDKASNYAIPSDAKIYSPVKTIKLDIAKAVLVGPQYVRSVKPPMCLDLTIRSR
ncbi:hypothetical protein QR680_002283 [Steinernema hermaphroditum]|uniref:Dolichol-phosphate mannose synthase subunit 3 n=1 Tax=Steinernema hermaphroditum TaxID=289476 RepID=A0AA39H247_9BILA|nr:hypothetical protein QR680_002283 [Steinernema hermaphroditum]